VGRALWPSGITLWPDYYGAVEWFSGCTTMELTLTTEPSFLQLRTDRSTTDLSRYANTRMINLLTHVNMHEKLIVMMKVVKQWPSSNA